MFPMVASNSVLVLLSVSLPIPAISLIQKLTSSECIRRLDIMNRGYSGYNSSQILKILAQLIPNTSSARVDYLVCQLFSELQEISWCSKMC